MVNHFSLFLRTIFIFYRGFRIPALIVTLMCWAGAFSAALGQLREHRPYYGIVMFLPPFFWIKVVTDSLIMLFLLRIKANENYFYYNLGIGKSTLWITTFIIDLLLFFLGMFLAGVVINRFVIPSP
ncbi:MAG: hypothetical protein WCK34_09615 [Bacteroidota bacterium]